MGLQYGLVHLGDIISLEEAPRIYEEVEQVINNYNMGSTNERYNQVINIWTHVNSELSNILMKTISSDDQDQLRIHDVDRFVV